MYKIKVLKAWDYARMIVQSEKLRIAYIKAEKDTRKHIFWHFEGQKVVPQGPFGQTKLYFEPESRPLGKIFHKLRIQGRMQFFEKEAPECFKSRFDRLER